MYKKIIGILICIFLILTSFSGFVSSLNVEINNTQINKQVINQIGNINKSNDIFHISKYTKSLNDEFQILTDPQGDVLFYDLLDEDYNYSTTDEKPNVDIKELRYIHNDGSNEATLILQVYGEIEDRGSLNESDMEEVFNTVAYAISLTTNTNSYLINYVNKTCALTKSDFNTENITDWSVNNDRLTINIDLDSTDETYVNMSAETIDIDIDFLFESGGFYFDTITNLLIVDAGGPYEGETGENIQFYGDVYDPAGTSNFFSYLWDFGDGFTSSFQNPLHSYDEAGNYTVILTVTNDNGLQGSDFTIANIKERDSTPPNINILKPKNVLYINNKEIISFFKPVIIGYINIEVNASDDESGIDRVEFYIDNDLKKTDLIKPYSWRWVEFSPLKFRYTIRIVAYDNNENAAEKEIQVRKYFNYNLINDKTTFYFKDVLGINSEPEYDSNLGLTVLVSDNPPLKWVDSEYPPSLFKKDTSKILHRNRLNSEELYAWATTWLFYFLDDLYDDFDDLFDGFELLFPHPYRIVQAYENDREEIIEIDGDIVFDIYLSSKSSSKYFRRDSIKVGLYSINSESIFPIPKLIMNKTIKINPKLLRDIHKQQIVLENVNHSLNPGESLLFQIEIIPSNKTIHKIISSKINIDKILERWGERANRWENSRIEKLHDVGEFINIIREIIEELNCTEKDIAEIVNTFRSASIVYDSIRHPTSVTMPIRFNKNDAINVFVEYGDCVDLNYIGRYASNNSIFDSSYNDTINKTGGPPLKVFVTLNNSEVSPLSGYNTVIEGFAEGLIGLKENESKIIGPIPPEKAYGVKPVIGDILDLTELIGVTQIYKIVDIKEDVEMPEELKPYFGSQNTTLYVLKEDWHYVGEILDLTSIYLSWENCSVVTKINDTKLWYYITPTNDIGEYFTWKYLDITTGSMITFPQDVSVITEMNENSIFVSHDPEINDIINVSYGGFYYMNYVIQDITEDTINASYSDPSTGDIQYMNFDKKHIIQRNQTQNITMEIPEEYLEIILQQLRMSLDDFNLSLDKLAGESLIFEVEIINIYKTSQE